MKRATMSLVILLVVFSVATGVVLAWTSNREPRRPQTTAASALELSDLESRIPYDIRITSTPPSWCDPVDLRVEFVADDHGTMLEERWTVMDGDSPQMTFPSFDDLYYRCDGPDCFRITHSQEGYAKVLYITLK